MPKVPCPICGDPSGYPLWVDSAPPDRCPQDPSWETGGPPQIRNLSECSYQRRKAEQRARWMRQCPEAFDDNGNLLPGGLAKCLAIMSPDEMVII